MHLVQVYVKNGKKYITLPNHYSRYIEACKADISESEAHKIYHKLVSFASSAKNDADYLHQKHQFDRLKQVSAPYRGKANYRLSR